MSSRSNAALFTARALRMCCFGGTAVIFLLFLADAAVRLSPVEITAALVAIFVGDLCKSLAITSRADRNGRRVSLVIAASLFGAVGLCFYFTASAPAIVVAGFLGVISPAGGEIGPFVSLEQAALAGIANRHYCGDGAAGGGTAGKERYASALTTLVAWYQLIGSAAQAGGALCTGFVMHQLVSDGGMTYARAYQHFFLAYSGGGVLLVLLYATLRDDVEPAPPAAGSADAPSSPPSSVQVVAATKPPAPSAMSMPSTTTLNDAAAAGDVPAGDESAPAQAGVACLAPLGLFRPVTQRNVCLFSSLFAVDAFGGGLVMQSYISWWFSVRWEMPVHHLGIMIMAVNLVAAVTGLAAGWLVSRIGAIRTMVFTHAPSNVLLALIVVMPTQASAIAVLLLRYSISQMDVPARQAYVALVVPKDEMSAANGLTNSIRSLGVALSAVALVPCIKATSGDLAHGAPFVVAGALKLTYDAAVYVLFTRATGEIGRATSGDGAGEACSSGAAVAAPADASASARTPLLKPQA